MGSLSKRSIGLLILKERLLSRVSKDEASSWFETALKKRLLTMRTATASPDE
jgi:hypothetical protein